MRAVVYSESGPLAPLYHGCDGSVSYVHRVCDMKGLEPKGVAWRSMGPKNKHRGGGVLGGPKHYFGWFLSGNLVGPLA